MLLVCICEPHHWPHARKISGFLQTCFGGKLSRLMSPIFPPSHNYVRPLRNCIKEPGYTRLDNPPFDGKVQVCAAALPRTCWRALLLLGHKKARKIGRGVTWMLSIFIHKAPDQMPHNSQRILSIAYTKLQIKCLTTHNALRLLYTQSSRSNASQLTTHCVFFVKFVDYTRQRVDYQRTNI